ncbi:MAG TPA: hypothetical protein VNQ32_08100 [Steroidobacteraceae bacterium]|nr:hypothetical protein [Steroidobacteraceae bacterium]
MMGRKDDNFSIHVPEDESERQMPDHLEIVETGPGGKPKKRLQGGAYDPYQKQDPGSPGDTARIRRPRVDLRKLSEWIKTTQQVKALREEDLLEAARGAPKADKPSK